MNAAAKGALAGLAATVPMTVAMELLWRRLPAQQRYPLPPREIIDRILPDDAGDERSQRLALAAHFGFGAATGALYPALTPSRQPSAGAAYGMGVWAASYLGWIPALGILKPASRHPAERNLLMIAVHLIWGASLAISLRELERRERDREPEGPAASAARAHAAAQARAGLWPGRPGVSGIGRSGRI